MKVYLFESEPWAKAAWHQTETRLESVWAEGLLTPDSLADMEQSGYFERTALYLKNYQVKPKDIIRPLDDPYNAPGRPPGFVRESGA